MAATQKWNDRPNKYNNDEDLFHVIRQVIPTTGTHNVLCLPGYSFRWERNLAEQNTLRNWQFYGLQPDGEGRDQLAVNGFELNHEYKLKGIETRFHSHSMSKLCKLRLENYVYQTDKTFSIIYADWMGGWYHRTRTTIETIFRRKLLHDGGLLMFTAQINCARSEPKTNGFASLVTYYNANAVRNVDPKIETIGEQDLKVGATSIDSIVKNAGSTRGYDLTLAHLGRYKGDRKAHDMFTFSYVCNKQK